MSTVLDEISIDSTNKPLVACPSCGSARGIAIGHCCVPVELSNAKGDAGLRQIVQRTSESELFECQDCYLQFRWPQLTASELEGLYANLPGTYWDYDSERVGSWKCASQFLSKAYSSTSPIRVLDVGAFEGDFLVTLPENWCKFAIEPAKLAAERLAERGIENLAPFVEQIDMEMHQQSFDVITMFDVFEHLPDPRGTLTAIARLLKPGGRLIISTGNSDHWSCRLLGARHWYLHSAQHLIVGNKRFFSNGAADWGVSVERIVGHSHQIEPSTKAIKQSLETVHAWARQSNRSFVMGLIHRIPGMSYLIHKSSSPFTSALRDHLMVVLRRPSDVAQTFSHPDKVSRHASTH